MDAAPRALSLTETAPAAFHAASGYPSLRSESGDVPTGVEREGSGRSPRSEESKRKTSESLKKAYAEGRRKFTPSGVEKMRQSLKLAHAEGRAGGFKPGNNLGSLVPEDKRKKRHAAAMAVVIGSHGFGAMARDLPSHLFAKSWVVRSPDGEEFEFSNLLAWCRANEHRFPPDTEKFKQPLWHRAAMGISKQSNEKDPRNQWREWVLVSVSTLGRVSLGGGGAEQAGDGNASTRSGAGSLTDASERQRGGNGDA